MRIRVSSPVKSNTRLSVVSSKISSLNSQDELLHVNRVPKNLKALTANRGVKDIIIEEQKPNDTSSRLDTEARKFAQIIEETLAAEGPLPKPAMLSRWA